MILRAIDSSLTGDVGQVRLPQDLLDLSLHTIASPAVVDGPPESRMPDNPSGGLKDG